MSARLLPAVLWTALCAACVDAPAEAIWPLSPQLGTRIVVTSHPSGERRFLRASDSEGVDFSFRLDADSEVFVLDYECLDPEALGFRSVGADRFDAPIGPVRSPEHAYVLDQADGTRFREIEIPAEASRLEQLGLDFRFPSACRYFDPGITSVTFAENQRSKFLLPLPDRSVLLVSEIDDGPENERLVFAHRLWSTERFESYSLPPGSPSAAGALDELGRLWLLGRDGTLWRGTLEDLSTPTRFEVMPAAAEAHNCGVPGAGLHNDTILSARVKTGTTTELLSIDGSGTVMYFDGNTWRVLRDPVAEGGSDFLCNVAPSEVLWIGPGEALMLNRALLSPSPQVIRLSFDEEGTPTFADDRSPSEVEGLERLLDLGPRGIYAGAGRGRLARRQNARWERLRPDMSLTRNVAALLAGPEGALIAGNGGEGLAQYWPEAEGGPVACLSNALTSRVRDAGLVDGEYVVALPSNDGEVRPIQYWHFRKPTTCEPYAN